MCKCKVRLQGCIVEAPINHQSNQSSAIPHYVLHDCKIVSTLTYMSNDFYLNVIDQKVSTI